MLSLTGDTLTLGLVTTGLADIGTYNIEVKVALQNTPSVFTTATFVAEVTACEVTSLARASVADQAYNIYTPSIQFSFTEFVQTPDCQYALDYTFQIKDSSGTYTTLPGFITESSKTFTVMSNDPADAGDYQVAVIAAVPTGYPAFQDELIVNLTVKTGCENDEVTPTGASISSFTYRMNQDGIVTFSPTWSSSIVGCPLTFEIRRVVSSVEQALTSHETAALTHSVVDGSL